VGIDDRFKPRGPQGLARRAWKSRLLDHPREVRERLFVDDRRIGLALLPDFRQVAAGQDREEPSPMVALSAIGVGC